MPNIDDSLEYVNQQLIFYKTRLDDPATKNTKFFQHHYTNTEALKAHLERLRIIDLSSDLTIQTTSFAPIRNRSEYISILPEDIEGLPPELIEELGLTESD